MEQTKKVWLAGAGPGDAGLLTVKTRELLEQADVVVYDALVSVEILSLIPEQTEKINVGKRADHHPVPQEEINRILAKEAKAGKRVLRLKGGDPFVFGRGGEELELLIREGIAFEVVPGITSAVAVAAYAGIPITHRDYTSSFHVITGHPKKDGTSRVNYEALVQMDATLVFLMGISAMETICENLIRAGMEPDMPAAVLEKGTTARQRNVVSTVAHLAADAKAAQIQTPAMILVGRVCALAKRFRWADARPLGGKQILVTRPKQHSSELAKKLRDLGAQVIELPSIMTEVIRENTALEQALLRIGRDSTRDGGEEWLVFTSPVGVELFFEQLEQMEFDLRKILGGQAEIKAAAIGSATARALKKRGIFADLVPEVYAAQQLGEALARTAAGNSYITIIRAKEGSELLIPPLERRGLAYADIPLYETICRADTVLKEQLVKMFEAQEIDFVTFTSASTVRGFTQTMGSMDYSKVAAICIGEQTAKAAKAYGMQIEISKEATMDSMIERMLEPAPRSR